MRDAHHSATTSAIEAGRAENAATRGDEDDDDHRDGVRADRRTPHDLEPAGAVGMREQTVGRVGQPVDVQHPGEREVRGDRARGCGQRGHDLAGRPPHSADEAHR